MEGIAGVPKKWKFGKLPTEIIESRISTHGKLLVACLLWHGEGEVWPGIRRLALMMTSSRRTVDRALKELTSYGLKIQRRPGGVNLYDLSRLGGGMRQGDVTPPGGGCARVTQGCVGVAHPPTPQGRINDLILNDTQELDFVFNGRKFKI